MLKSNNFSLIGGVLVTSGKIVLSGVIFSRLKKKEKPNGEKVVLFDLLVGGKKSYSVINVMTTGQLAEETEHNYSFIDTAPFVNAEGRVMSGVRKHGGKPRAVVYFIADKVEFVKELGLIPYKVV